MRVIGLVLAVSLMAACGSPDTDAPSNIAAEAPQGPGPANESAANDQSEKPVPSDVTNAESAAAEPASACMIQGDDRLQVRPIRAVGTEPFWGARVEGRCVTYSHPEDLKGIRVWTHYSGQGGGRSLWVGQLGGRAFEMRVRQADCSDGMSDRHYPMKVELLVNGEKREGCAEPL